MKLLLLATFAAVMIAAPATAEMKQIPTPPQRNAIPLYPQDKVADVEQWSQAVDSNGQGGGSFVRNVTRPTLTPYLPDPARATGAAVVVAPGGGFVSLSMTGEGENVARWLADHGVAAFVLKYRLTESPRDEKAFVQFSSQRIATAIQRGDTSSIQYPRATDDALAALALVRARAKEFRVDPARVGMIGFSAGAKTTLNATLQGKGDARPAFIGYIYGPMTAIAVPADAPPMFNAIAMDDILFKGQGFGIVESWRQARRPVELHAYERGQHGFGTGLPATTSTGVMPQFLEWLRMRGLLKPAR